MTQQDAQDARIGAIIGDDDESTFDDCVASFFDHLTTALRLPCDVTGIEDFRWEEYYVLGPGDPKEHEQLRKNQPSYEDTFELLAIEEDVVSDWMMYHGEDLAGHVRRKSDGKEFYLGLAEIEAVDKKSTNYQLLDDYAVWFVNNR
ncbi:MAG: hypothetical protein ABIK89_02625 [Planctomycetota bacterium]